MTKQQKTAKRLKNKKHKEWSLAVRKRADFKCEWCPRTSKDVKLNAHHIITKKFEPLCFSVDNGLCLCPRCHRFKILCAHNDPIGVFLWLQDNRPIALNYLIKILKGEQNGRNN